MENKIYIMKKDNGKITEEQFKESLQLVRTHQEVVEAYLLQKQDEQRLLLSLDYFHMEEGLYLCKPCLCLVIHKGQKQEDTVQIIRYSENLGYDLMGSRVFCEKDEIMPKLREWVNRKYGIKLNRQTFVDKFTPYLDYLT